MPYVLLRVLKITDHPSCGWKFPGSDLFGQWGYLKKPSRNQIMQNLPDPGSGFDEL